MFFLQGKRLEQGVADREYGLLCVRSSRVEERREWGARFILAARWCGGDGPRRLSGTERGGSTALEEELVFRTASHPLLDRRLREDPYWIYLCPPMKLTRYSDYSLRVLMYLAIRSDRLATIEEISRAYGISRAHLTKIAHELGRAGFLETVRGRGGGLRLARELDAISVGEVVRFTEGRMDLVECFDPETNTCRIESACSLHGVFQTALDAFLATLDEHTLADLVARRRKPMAKLLALS